MKITKAQLKQIIKEELERLNEGSWDLDPEHTDVFQGAQSQIYTFDSKLAETTVGLIKAGDIESITARLEQFAENLNNPEIVAAMDEISDWGFSRGRQVRGAAGSSSHPEDRSPESDRWKIRSVQHHGIDKFTQDVIEVTKRNRGFSRMRSRP